MVQTYQYFPEASVAEHETSITFEDKNINCVKQSNISQCKITRSRKKSYHRMKEDPKTTTTKKFKTLTITITTLGTMYLLEISRTFANSNALCFLVHLHMFETTHKIMEGRGSKDQELGIRNVLLVVVGGGGGEPGYPRLPLISLRE